MESPQRTLKPRGRANNRSVIAGSKWHLGEGSDPCDDGTARQAGRTPATPCGPAPRPPAATEGSRAKMTAGAKEKSALRLEGRTSAERGAEKAAGGGHLHAPATWRLPSRVEGPGAGAAFGASLAASSACPASLLDTPPPQGHLPRPQPRSSWPHSITSQRPPADCKHPSGKPASIPATPKGTPPSRHLTTSDPQPRDTLDLRRSSREFCLL